MIQIRTISMKRMGKSLHAEFHSAVLNEEARHGGAEAIGLEPTTVEDYAANVTAEGGRMARQGKSAITEQLARLDEQRDGLVEAILMRLRHLDLWPDAKVQAAEKEVQRLITDGYTLAVKREPMQHKSAMIGALLKDLEKIDADVLATLGVDVLARELRRVNDGHGLAYLARNKEHVDPGVGIVARLRREVDRLYRRMCLEATYQANRTDSALAAVADATERERQTARREAARLFIGDLNEHIAYYKHYYLRLGGDEGTAIATEGGA